MAKAQKEKKKKSIFQKITTISVWLMVIGMIAGLVIPALGALGL